MTDCVCGKKVCKAVDKDARIAELEGKVSELEQGLEVAHAHLSARYAGYMTEVAERLEVPLVKLIATCITGNSKYASGQLELTEEVFKVANKHFLDVMGMGSSVPEPSMHDTALYIRNAMDEVQGSHLDYSNTSKPSV